MVVVTARERESHAQSMQLNINRVHSAFIGCGLCNSVAERKETADYLGEGTWAIKIAV